MARRSPNDALGSHPTDGHPTNTVPFTPDVRAPLPQSVPDRQPDLVAELMSDGFARLHPDLAARSGFRRWQIVAGVAVAGLLIATILLVPQVAALVLATATLSIGLVVSRVGLAGRRLARASAQSPGCCSCCR